MKDFLPVIYPQNGTHYRDDTAEEDMVNCVPWILQQGEIGACPRNEFTALDNPPSASTDRGRGITIFGGQLNLYLTETSYYYNGGNTDLTATTSPGYAGNTGFNEEYLGSFVFHRVSDVENLVIVNAGHTSTHASANHGNIWYAADASSAPSSVSDADLPCNAGVSITRGGVSLDGYFFIGDIRGRIYNSDLNDITAWTATNFLTAEREPDAGVYIGKHHDHIVYIGTRSIEFFYNAANATGSPLARRTDVSYNIGCYYPNSIIEVGDNIYFVGTEKGSGKTSVYSLMNFALTVISNPKIDELLRGAQGDYPDITALDSLKHRLWLSYSSAADSPGLILTLDTAWTYYWHQLTNKWNSWKYGSTINYAGGTSGTNWGQILPIVSHNRSSGASSLARYQLTNGRIIYEGTPDNDALSDWASSAPSVYMQFPRWDAGTDSKKKVLGVKVLTAPVSSDGNQYDPMNVDLRWFDYKTAVTAGPNPPDGDYSTARTVDINKRGARVARCGVTRERSFILDWPTGHGPVSVVKGLEIDYEIVGE